MARYLLDKWCSHYVSYYSNPGAACDKSLQASWGSSSILHFDTTQKRILEQHPFVNPRPFGWYHSKNPLAFRQAPMTGKIKSELRLTRRNAENIEIIYTKMSVCLPSGCLSFKPEACLNAYTLLDTIMKEVTGEKKD